MDGVTVATLPQTGVTTMPDNMAFALYNPAALASFPSTMLVDDVQVSAIYTNLCRPDFNGDHAVNVSDIFDFLSAWFAGNPNADFNSVGGISVQDIFDFLSAWFVGCP